LAGSGGAWGESEGATGAGNTTNHIQGTYRNICGTFAKHLENIWRTFGEYSVLKAGESEGAEVAEYTTNHIQGTFGEHSGNIRGTFGEHLRNIWGTFGNVQY
jgi:hypothetical protein